MKSKDRVCLQGTEVAEMSNFLVSNLQSVHDVKQLHLPTMKMVLLLCGKIPNCTL